MQEEFEKALYANNEANTKLDWIYTLTSISDALLVNTDIIARLKSKTEASKYLER